MRHLSQVVCLLQCSYNFTQEFNHTKQLKVNISFMGNKVCFLIHLKSGSFSMRDGWVDMSEGACNLRREVLIHSPPILPYMQHRCKKEGTSLFVMLRGITHIVIPAHLAEFDYFNKLIVIRFRLLTIMLCNCMLLWHSG